MRNRIALLVIAIGVTVFFLALYGVFGSTSSILTAIGLAVLLAGLLILVFSFRFSTLSKPHAATFAMAVLGSTLHVYEQAQAPDSFSMGWLLWALMPYAVCLAASAVPVTRTPSIVGVTVVLIFDLWIHYSVFISPAGSTAALVLIFAPLWSALVFAPITMFVTWLIARAYFYRTESPNQ